MSHSSDQSSKQVPWLLAFLSIVGQLAALFVGATVMASLIYFSGTPVLTVALVLAALAALGGALFWRSSLGPILVLLAGLLLVTLGANAIPFELVTPEGPLVLTGGLGLVALSFFARADEALF